MRGGKVQHVGGTEWLMDYDDEDLKNTISHLTDEQLVRMLTVDSSEYRKEALEFAEAEIRARSISLWESTQQSSNAAVQEQQIQVSPGYPPDINLPSPFEHFRARSLPIWSFLALLLIGLKDTFLTRYTTFGTSGS